MVVMLTDVIVIIMVNTFNENSYSYDGDRDNYDDKSRYTNEKEIVYSNRNRKCKHDTRNHTVVSDSERSCQYQKLLLDDNQSIHFFNTPKQMEVIQRAIENLFTKAMSIRVKQLCPTRCVERHNSIFQLQEMVPGVHEVMKKFCNRKMLNHCHWQHSFNVQ